MTSDSDKDRTLKVFDGGKVDPSDINDTPEELEAYLLKLGDDIAAIALYKPEAKLDRPIVTIKNGLILIESLAGNPHKTLAEIVDEDARYHIAIQPVAEADNRYVDYVADDGKFLEMLGQIMYGENFDNFIASNPSEAWKIKETKDAIISGVGNATAVIELLNPKNEGEDPTAYRYRLQEYIKTEIVKIAKLTENPPV